MRNNLNVTGRSQLMQAGFYFLAFNFACVSISFADESDGNSDPTSTLTEQWSVLWDARRTPAKPSPLPDDSPLEVLNEFQLKGIPTADRFQLRSVKTDGVWGSKNRWLVRMAGRDSAIKLARGNSFELEGVFKAEGRGGWFVLFGWDNGHGYGIYNVTLKESGSVWFLTEFRDSAAIEATHREASRFVWKGTLPLRLQVSHQKLNLRVGRTQLLKEIELPNYGNGDIILGTYNTPYGPKPVAVRSLRIRKK